MVGNTEVTPRALAAVSLKDLAVKVGDTIILLVMYGIVIVAICRDIARKRNGDYAARQLRNSK